MSDFTREEIEAVVKAAQKLDKANLAGIELSGADRKVHTREPTVRRAQSALQKEFPRPDPAISESNA